MDFSDTDRCLTFPGITAISRITISTVPGIQDTWDTGSTIRDIFTTDIPGDGDSPAIAADGWRGRRYPDGPVS